VQRKELPEDIPVVSISLGGRPSIKLFELLVEAQLAGSKSEARRLVQQGGVSLDRQRVEDPLLSVVQGEKLVQVGKRRFAKVAVS
jgi:tyrosyl-tRNA synthetase